MITYDIRYALRSLRKSPVFVTIATISLGLGLALSTTMFSMLDSVRHPHAPYREPDRIVAIVPYGTGPRQAGPNSSMRAEIFQALKGGSRAFEGIAGAVQYGFLAQAPGYAGDHTGYYVTENYFSLLGIKPEVGRGFPPGVSGPAAGVVISYAVWQRAFQGRPLVPALSLTLGDKRYEVVGVMSHEMGAPLWLRTEGDGVTNPGITPVGRLRAGVTLKQAQAEVDVIAARLTLAYGAGAQPFSFQLRPFTPVAAEFQDYHGALLAGALAVLLLACGNLANLMLARGLSRRRELALRLAIGATRGALIRQMLAEALLIAGAGAALGSALSAWGIGLARHNMPTETTGIGRMVPHLDWRFFLFVMLASGISIVLFGLLPAIRASNVSVTEPLKDGATSTGRTRRRYSLVVVSEVALCLAVLMGAVLLTRALNRVESSRLGYDPQGLLTASIRLSAKEVPADKDIRGRYEGIVAGLRTDPHTTDVATWVTARPRGRAITSDLEGSEPTFTNTETYQVVSSNFLRLLRIPVVEGRDFDLGDETATDVAIIDEAARDQLWGGTNPVGRMIKLGGPSTDGPWVRVVGVAQTVRLTGSFDPFTGNRTVQPNVFVVRPSENSRNKQLVVRVKGDEAEAMVSLRGQLRASFPQSMNVWGGGRFYPFLLGFRDLIETRRFLAGLFAFFAVFSLVLAAVGLYGVLAYTVNQRMREFGVRGALGAQREHLLRLVLHDGAVMALAGTGIGAWIAMGQSALLDYWLYDLHPTDVVSLVVAEAVLVSVSLVACWIPARRATRANPLDVLRAT